MAKNSDHLRQWEHNRRFLATITADYPDWVVTVSFYAALHAVDALLVYDGVSSVVSHDSRNRTLRQTNRYQKLYLAYEPLYSLARTVRYIADSRRWIAVADIPTRVFKLLRDIEISVSKLMQIELEAPPLPDISR